ncbi:hypothetical protein LSH36_341g05016 [Paralvinella palmiformis]|uniref:Uncharacterized protein n=1 Tax=Paralvinella palmiformis TaxID=53620 RepID=A0AAD9N2P8_9ANNE|nr:hypothetical protein LSH36_341g05016 [Paralvinella palmiformis]
MTTRQKPKTPNSRYQFKLAQRHSFRPLPLRNVNQLAENERTFHRNVTRSRLPRNRRQLNSVERNRCGDSRWKTPTPGQAHTRTITKLGHPLLARWQHDDRLSTGRAV